MVTIPLAKSRNDPTMVLEEWPLLLPYVFVPWTDLYINALRLWPGHDDARSGIPGSARRGHEQCSRLLGRHLEGLPEPSREG